MSRPRFFFETVFCKAPTKVHQLRSPSSPPQKERTHVDRSSPTDPLAVVVRDGRPPIRLGFDKPQDDVLDRGRHARNLPGDVGLPATPRLGEVLEDRLGLVLLDALGHHVEDVVHDGGAELEVEVRLDTLLGDGLGDAGGRGKLSSCFDTNGEGEEWTYPLELRPSN